MTNEVMRLLRRPRSMPPMDRDKPGRNAEYKIKLVYYKHGQDIVPRVCYNAKAHIDYAHLTIKSSWPPTKLKIPLVTICYIEADDKYDRFDVRGRQLQLHMIGFRDVMYPMATLEESRDWLRFLVVRQRIPHSILKLPFEWELTPVKSFRNNFSIKRLKSFLLCHRSAANVSP